MLHLNYVVYYSKGVIQQQFTKQILSDIHHKIKKTISYVAAAFIGVLWDETYSQWSEKVWYWVFQGLKLDNSELKSL